jgi:hypothetical protein
MIALVKTGGPTTTLEPLYRLRSLGTGLEPAGRCGGVQRVGNAGQATTYWE